jgi:hypothetical protein
VRRKKGQANASAAGSLIGVILLLFLFYILFLPPAERAEILNEPGQGFGGQFQGSGGPTRDVLVREPVGRLDFIPAEGLKIPIPNAYLEETKETKLLATGGFFNVKKFLRSRRKVIEFRASTQSAILTYQVQDAKGVLRIRLNDRIIFEDRVTSPSPLILSDLRAVNTLTFEVTGRFFEKKSYNLLDVKIVENIPLLNRQTMEHSFTVTEKEYDNIERAVFTFFPGCLQSDVGTITVSLNGNQLSQTVPSCDTINVQEIDKAELRSGKNVLRMFLDKGRVQMEQATVELSFAGGQGYLKYFNLPSRLEVDAQRGLAHVVMRVTFVDDKKSHRAITNINGVLDAIDQKEAVFERDISRIVRGGNNYLQITPRTSLEILELEIRVE